VPEIEPHFEREYRANVPALGTSLCAEDHGLKAGMGRSQSSIAARDALNSCPARPATRGERN